MRLLQDTQLLLWAAMFPERLSAAARTFIDDPSNVLIFGAASIWEIAIKSAQRRDDFRVDHGSFTAACSIMGTSSCP